MNGQANKDVEHRSGAAEVGTVLGLVFGMGGLVVMSMTGAARIMGLL